MTSSTWERNQRAKREARNAARRAYLAAVEARNELRDVSRPDVSHALTEGVWHELHAVRDEFSALATRLSVVLDAWQT